MAVARISPRVASRRRRVGVTLLAGVTGLIGVAEVRARAPEGALVAWWLEADAATLLAASLAVPILSAVCVTSRQPVVGRRWARRLRAHLMVGGVAALTAAVAEGAAHLLLPWAAAAFTSGLFAVGLLWYVMSAVVAHVPVLAKRARQGHAVRLRIVQASEQAGWEQAAAQFRAVKTELHPVFITNALSTIQTLVSRDPETAERMIVELGLLMREAVTGAGSDAVALGDEFDTARERSGQEAGGGEHLPDALGTGVVHYVVDDDVRDVLVPHLVLPALLACVSEAGWADDGLIVRGKRVTLAGETWLELAVDAVRATPRRGTATRAPAAPHAVAALGRLLHHFYRDGDARCRFSTETTADGARRACLRLHVSGEDQPTSAPARLTDPGERAFEEWLATATTDDALARRRGTPALGVIGLGVLLVAYRWRDSMTAYDAGWAAGVVLSSTGATALTVALVGVAAVKAAHRWPGEMGERPARSVGCHIAVGFGVSVLAAGLRAACANAAYTAGLTAIRPFTDGEVVLRSVSFFVLYAAFVTVMRLALLGQEHRRTAQLAGRAHAAYRSRVAGQRRSELRALKAELNPHFVGNALHTAAALIRSAPDAAIQLLASLGTLAGHAGTQVGVQEVCLLDEIAELDPFLALERARLGTAGGQLTVVWDIEPDAAAAAVPHLSLQPLVENAVRHGLAPRGGQGRLTIRARRAGAVLELTVADDGVGMRLDEGRGPSQPTARARAGGARPGTGGLGSGAGLSGVRQRLGLLYGAEAACVLEPNPTGGTVVRLTVPYRKIAPDRPADQLLAAAGG